MTDNPLNIRYPLRTWDGREIGFREALVGENAARKAHATFVKRKKAYADYMALPRFRGGAIKGKPKRTSAKQNISMASRRGTK